MKFLLSLLILGASSSAWATCTNFSGDWETLYYVTYQGQRLPASPGDGIRIRQSGCEKITVYMKSGRDTESVTFVPDGTPALIHTNAPETPILMYGSYLIEGYRIVGKITPYNMVHIFDLEDRNHMTMIVGQPDGSSFFNYTQRRR